MSDRFADATQSMNEVMNLDGDPDRLRAYYAQWAPAYDEDVTSHGYGLPPMMVTLMRAAADLDDSTAWLLDESVEIIDVGCGTGLVGVELAAAGYEAIDGIDLSPEMVAVAAERGIYRELTGGVDITQPAPADLLGRYDVAAVAGVFTVGHVPPESLEVVASMVRPGGIVLASTRQAYFVETDFQDYSDRMIATGALELLVRIDDAPYTMDSTAHYWAYRTPARNRS